MEATRSLLILVWNRRNIYKKLLRPAVGKKLLKSASKTLLKLSDL
jgi:hypothetical protein